MLLPNKGLVGAANPAIKSASPGVRQTGELEVHQGELMLAKTVRELTQLRITPSGRLAPEVTEVG